MPRNAAAIQTLAPVAQAQLVNYSDGEMVWATQNGNIQEPVSVLRREEVVFILRSRENNGYFIYSVREASKDEASGDGPPFELSIRFAAQLPEEALTGFLLDEVPSHLRSDGRNQLVDVIVSTRSGIGQASAFYDGVLHQLLEALGLRTPGLGLSGPAGEAWSGEDAGPAEDGTNGYGYRYRVTVTKSSKTIRDFAQGLAGADGRSGTKGVQNGGAAPGPSRTIILLSGDGGVVDLLNELDRPALKDAQPPTVVVLPLGTGNALFHSLHRPHHKAATASNGAKPALAPSPLVLSLRTLFRGTPAPLPTFKASFSPRSRLISAPEPVSNGADHAAANGSTNGNGTVADSEEKEPTEVDHLIGAIVASYGFHASLVWESDTPAYRVHGDKRFGMAAAELLKLSHAYDATVEIVRSSPSPESTNGSDGHTNGAKSSVKLRGEQKFNYVLATMVSNLEKTFTISPASKPLDGQLRLVHFGDVGGDKTMEIMMAAYRGGEHVGMRWTTSTTVTSAASSEGGDSDEQEREDGVGYEEVEEVKVTIGEEDPRWRKVCIDGTIVELEKDGWMVVRRDDRERLRVLVDRDVL